MIINSVNIWPVIGLQMTSSGWGHFLRSLIFWAYAPFNSEEYT